MNTSLCDKGEYGAFYEVYELAGWPGYSVIFEKGRYDGFNAGEVGKMLIVLSIVAHDSARTTGRACSATPFA